MCGVALLAFFLKEERKSAFFLAITTTNEDLSFKWVDMLVCNHQTDDNGIVVLIYKKVNVCLFEREQFFIDITMIMMINLFINLHLMTFARILFIYVGTSRNMTWWHGTKMKDIFLDKEQRHVYTHISSITDNYKK